MQGEYQGDALGFESEESRLTASLEKDLEMGLLFHKGYGTIYGHTNANTKANAT